jgi:hypothetical protein
VTRTVTVQEEAAPPETIAALETTTGTVEASAAEPTSPCGGAPEDVLALQYRLINAGDYEDAYGLFAERSKGPRWAPGARSRSRAPTAPPSTV